MCGGFWGGVWGFWDVNCFVVRCSDVWPEGVFVRGLVFCWDKCLWRLYEKNVV